MSNTDKDGKIIELSATSAEADGAEPVTEKKQEDQKEIKPPICGFDESGYFYVKIDARYGYLSILGYLQESADWLKYHVNQQKIAAMKEEKHGLVKPNFFKKAAGRFNLFKGK